MNTYKSMIYLTREEKNQLIELIDLNLESLTDDNEHTKEEIQEQQLCIRLKNKLMTYE